MREFLLCPMAILALALTSGCGGSDGSGESDEVRSETFHWSGQVDVGDLIEIQGVAGDVRFLQTSGVAVQVDAVKSGRKDAPSTVTVEVFEHRWRPHLCDLSRCPGPGPKLLRP